MRPILLAAASVNHSAPSGPAVMPAGLLLAVGIVNSVMACMVAPIGCRNDGAPQMRVAQGMRQKVIASKEEAEPLIEMRPYSAAALFGPNKLCSVRSWQFDLASARR